MNWKYTKIDHEARRNFGLTLIEYAYLDYIYHVQTWPDGTGWCEESYEEIRHHFDISKGGASLLDQRLFNAEFLEIISDKRKIKRKTTSKFYGHYLTDRSFNEQDRSQNERLRSQNERLRSQNERYNGSSKESKVKKDNKAVFVIPTIEQIEPLVKNSLSIHLVDTAGKPLAIVEDLYKQEAKSFHVHYTVHDWFLANGKKMSSVAGAVNTWVSNHKKWGDYDRIKPKPATTYTTDKPAAQIYDRDMSTLQDLFGTPSLDKV